MAVNICELLNSKYIKLNWQTQSLIFLTRRDDLGNSLALYVPDCPYISVFHFHNNCEPINLKVSSKLLISPETFFLMLTSVKQ